MKNRRKKAKSSSSQSNYLPPEIWTQILSSLPSKTLLTFRCVCKSWCSIIDHPYFVHLHFQLCKFNSPNNNNKLYVALERFSRNGDKGWWLSVRQANTLRKTGHIFKVTTLYKYHILSSCNGLFLVVHYPTPYYKPFQLRLWNPCISKSFVLPTSPLPDSFSSLKYLFGFATDSRDYKVVAIAYHDISQDIEHRNMYYAVYTLRDQQWTVRNYPLNITNLNVPNMAALFQYLSSDVYFRGGAYWLARNDLQSSECLTHLGSFDFDKENVTFLELPFNPDKTDSLKFVFLLEESLAVFSISKVTSSIWVLEQDNKKRPWTLWFSGKSSCDGYSLFSTIRYGSIKKIFYCERGGGYFVCGNKIYNLVSCQVQELNKSMSSCLKLEKYSESLVLSKGYKTSDMRYLP